MPFLLLLVLWFSWGVSYPVTAIALAGFDVLTLRAMVQVLGLAALAVQAWTAGRSFAVGREARPDLAVSGLLNMAVFPICMNLGVWLMGPGRTSILVYTMPIWSCLFARLILGEPFTRNRVAALVLGAAAVAVMVSQDLSHLRNAPLGAAVTLLAAMVYGLGTVLLKRRIWQADPSVVAFWQLVIGTVPMILVWAVLAAPVDLSRAGAAQWGSLIFLGVIANGAAYFAWFRIVRLLPAGVSGISSLAVPCVGVASSAWLTHERLSPQDLTTMALIAAALLSVITEQAAHTRRATPVAGKSGGAGVSADNC